MVLIDVSVVDAVGLTNDDDEEEEEAATILTFDSATPLLLLLILLLLLLLCCAIGDGDDVRGIYDEWTVLMEVKSTTGA
jgi:hypothetical protein